MLIHTFFYKQECKIMSSVGIRVKLDVSKIDKNRLFKGAKGVYLDATVFIDIDQKDQYENNGMITQDVTKEEREGGVKGPILGNVQVFWQGESKQQGQQPQQNQGQPQQQPQQAPAKYQQQQPPAQSQPSGDFDNSFDDDCAF